MPWQPVAEDAGPVRGQPGQVAAVDLVAVRGVDELEPGAGKDQIDLRHARDPTPRTRPAVPVSDGNLEPCGWASSTSGPTPATCWWWTRTPVPRRCRRRRTRSRCGSPSTSTRTARVSQTGIDALTGFVASALRAGRGQGLRGDLRVRDLGGPRGEQRRRGARARPRADRRGHQVLSGEDEARLTFLAVRRWFGWSSGRLGGLRHRRWLAGDRGRRGRGARRGLVAAAGRRPAGPRVLRATARPTRTSCASCAGRSGPRSPATPAACCAAVPLDHAVATSKTFRSLARICGAAPSERGPVRPPDAARRRAGGVAAEAADDDRRRDRASCPASPRTGRTRSSPGAFVASAVMDIFDLTELEICPWALREGIILERLDKTAACLG